MKTIFRKHLQALIFTSTAMLVSDVFSQVAAPANSLPAIPSEPANLAQAAGSYLGAADFLFFVKGSPCGYALKRNPNPYDKIINDEIVGYFPGSQRKEIATALFSMKNEVNNQSRLMFDGLYKYFTTQENLDHKTACGFIASTAITNRKIMAEMLQRKSQAR